MSREKMISAFSTYLNTGIISHNVREEILESWKRCREIGVNPYQIKANEILSDEEFEKVLADNTHLIKYSVAFMKDLYKFVEGFGLAVALTDANGVLLKIIGDEKPLQTLRLGNFIEGASWSETSAGTNAISMSLCTGVPYQIVSYEHFCMCSQTVTCSCAPIRDENCNIQGFINIVEKSDNTNKYTLSLAVASAIAIEYCLKMVKNQERCQIANSYKQLIINSISQGVIAVDSNGIITHFNDLAKNMLQYSPDSVFIGKNVLKIFPTEEYMLKEIMERRRVLADEEITLTGKYKAASCMVSTHEIIMDDKYDGILFILDEITRVKRMAHKITNAVAALSFDDLIGEDPSYKRVIEFAKLAAKSDSNVLLLGESGSGKDVLAQAIHNASNRHYGPFVAINCSAIPRELIASELFGYEEGAFTGARKGGNPGKFELCDGGTLFLDEIGEMPPDLQASLLRVIEEKSITRVGGQKVIPVDVRIISATNKNLDEEIEKGLFRQDLFYRLNVMKIVIPPLRERKRDIQALAESFYVTLCHNMKKKVQSIPQEYIDILMNYQFPGNIRELRNIIERSVNLSKDGELDILSIPQEVVDHSVENHILSEVNRYSGIKKHLNINPTLSVEEFERQKILLLLKRFEGNVSAVASELQIARTTLYRKMKRYNIQNRERSKS